MVEDYREIEIRIDESNAGRITATELEDESQAELKTHSLSVEMFSESPGSDHSYA